MTVTSLPKITVIRGRANWQSLLASNLKKAIDEDIFELKQTEHFRFGRAYTVRSTKSSEPAIVVRNIQQIFLGQYGISQELSMDFTTLHSTYYKTLQLQLVGGIRDFTQLYMYPHFTQPPADHHQSQYDHDNIAVLALFSKKNNVSPLQCAPFNSH